MLCRSVHMHALVEDVEAGEQSTPSAFARDRACEEYSTLTNIYVNPSPNRPSP